MVVITIVKKNKYTQRHWYLFSSGRFPSFSQLSLPYVILR